MANSVSSTSTYKKRTTKLMAEANVVDQIIPIRLRTKDLHPEIMGSWSTKRLEELKKKKQRRLKRTPMGEYIPPPEKPPLTILALPTPSAFDYYPNAEKVYNTSPKYTIAKRFRVFKKPPTAGPGDYGKEEELYTKCKAPTLKHRWTQFTHLNKEKKYQSVDPASYNLPSTLSRTHKAIIASRPPPQVNKGMLPSFPYPPPGSSNTVGFYAPIPTLQKGCKFGIIPPPLSKDKFPGPIYDVPPRFPEGLKFQLLQRFPWPPKIEGWDAPAPNTYLPISQLGKSGIFPRVTQRLPSVIQGNKMGPGPNRYTQVFQKQGARPSSMSYHPLPSRFPRQPLPGPAEYLIEPLLLPKQSLTRTGKEIKGEPHKRIKGPKLIGRPDTMINLRHAAIDNEPPESIHLCYFKDVEFGLGKPSARIRSRPVEKKDRKIAPNKYHPCSDPKLKRIPAFTFGQKITRKTEPLTINVEPRPLPSTLELKNQFTFGIPLTQRPSEIPSPTKYSVPSTFHCVKKTKPCPGPSLKGRRTPFAHLGIAKLRTPVVPTKLHEKRSQKKK